MEQLAQLDLQLFNYINHTLACTPLDFICIALRDKLCMGAVYAAIAYYLFKNHRAQFLKIAAAGALVYLFTDQLSASVVKKIFERVRPCNNAEVSARLLLQQCGSGFSFVSAHAANVFGTASFVFIVSRFSKKIFVVLFTWATLVSFAQVYVGVHYPSDVIGGAMLGILTGAVIGFTLLKLVPTLTRE